MLENLTHQEKLELTEMIMHLLDDWGVSHRDKLNLLAMPDDVRVRSVRRFYEDKPS